MYNVLLDSICVIPPVTFLHTSTDIREKPSIYLYIFRAMYEKCDAKKKTRFLYYSLNDEHHEIDNYFSNAS